MKPEEKELVLRDLCGRLPYWVKVKVRYYYEYEDGTSKKYNEIKYFDAEILDLLISGDRSLDGIKPYLRPMSSMTEEEMEEFENFVFPSEEDENGNYQTGVLEKDIPNYTDWLNKKMFDYRGLIPKGLANEAKEGMYNN